MPLQSNAEYDKIELIDKYQYIIFKKEVLFVSRKLTTYVVVALFVTCACCVRYSRRLKPIIYDGPGPSEKTIHLAVAQLPTT